MFSFPLPWLPYAYQRTKYGLWILDPGWGGLPCERGGDAYPEIRIKPLRETNLRVAQAFLTLNTGYQ